MDPDSPWEDNPRVDHAPEAEWTKIVSDFTNSGYREGITAGKEAFLQEGFDAGFADVGVPLGRQLGNLRGVVAAIGSFLDLQNPNPPELEELRGISDTLSATRFSDIAPRDPEAEKHAHEHLAFNDPTTVENTGSAADPVSRERCATEDLAKVKERLALLCKKLELPVLA